MKKNLFVLAALLAAGMVVGCGNQQASDTSTSEETKTSDVVASSEGKASETPVVSESSVTPVVSESSAAPVAESVTVNVEIKEYIKNDAHKTDVATFNYASALGLDATKFDVKATLSSDGFNAGTFDRNQQLALYKDSSITFTCTGIVVDSVSFTVAGKAADKEPGTITVKAGETEIAEADGKYAVNSASFSINNAGSQSRLSNIVIVYHAA